MRTTPPCLARFWAGVLGRELTVDPDDPDVVVLLPNDDTEFRIEFSPTQEPKTGPNQMHFDLTSQSLEEQQATVAQGARARRPAPRHRPGPGRGPRGAWPTPRATSSASSQPGNNFLADTGLIGALSSDGTQAGRLLLERGARLAAGLGPGRGDRDPVAARRLEDLLGRSARGAEAREEPPAPRHRATCRR